MPRGRLNFFPGASIAQTYYQHRAANFYFVVYVLTSNSLPCGILRIRKSKTSKKWEVEDVGSYFEWRRSFFLIRNHGLECYLGRLVHICRNLVGVLGAPTGNCSSSPCWR